MKLPSNRWSDALIPVVEFINNTPHSVTRFPPAQLMRGYLSSELHFRQRVPNQLKQQWELAKRRLEGEQKYYVRKSKEPVKLSPGTKIWCWLRKGNAKEKVRAKVILDSGFQCLVQKVDENENHIEQRFGVVSVSKSCVSVRLQ